MHFWQFFLIFLSNFNSPAYYFKAFLWELALKKEKSIYNF